MLGLFSAKSDHPLADAKEAKRLFAELAGKDAAAALDDAAILLESLHQDHLVGLEQRWAILQQMDATLLATARRFARDYAAAVHATRSEEMRQWHLGADYWKQLATSYLGCLTELPSTPAKVRDALKPELPLLYARTLHALTVNLKWQQFRYGPNASDFWHTTGKVYLEAVAAKVAQKTITLYPDATAPSSAEREYLKALAFHASSMDSLLPQEIELAERLLDHLLPQFQFGDQERPESVYWVDATTPQPPMRLAVKPARAPGLRYFSPGMALDAAYALKIQAEQSIPASLSLGNSYPASMVVDVLDHLATYWSPIPPQRSHARHRVKSRMAVVPALAASYRCLAANGDGRVAESWLVEDVSQGGMRATASLGKDSRLAINTLLLMQPEGGSNWLLGVVRRFARESDSSAGVGIETLTKQPRALCVDSGGIQTEVILIDPWASSAQVRVALPATAWEDNIAMTFNDAGKSVKLVPDGQVQSGPDYMIGRYRVRVAE